MRAAYGSHLWGKVSAMARPYSRLSISTLPNRIIIRHITNYCFLMFIMCLSNNYISNICRDAPWRVRLA